VEHYLRLAPARGAQTDAARRAGYRGSTKLNMARIASELMDPEVSIHDVKVVHAVVDLDEEGLEELRALRQLGTAREKLLELFGPNGLDRLERLEASRADKAKVIDGEVINDARR